MARGRHVDTLCRVEKFGLVIFYPELEGQSFKAYQDIYVSEEGVLIGTWKMYDYKDLLGKIGKNLELIRRTDGYLFFKATN